MLNQFFLQEIKLKKLVIKVSQVFLCLFQYFKKKLEKRPDFQISFQNYFSVAAMVPNVLMMLLNIFYLHRYVFINTSIVLDHSLCKKLWYRSQFLEIYWSFEYLSYKIV